MRAAQVAEGTKRRGFLVGDARDLKRLRRAWFWCCLAGAWCAGGVGDDGGSLRRVFSRLPMEA